MKIIEFKNIMSLEDMENYINSTKDMVNSLENQTLQTKVNEKIHANGIGGKGFINCFENRILQELSKHFREKQLFIIEKKNQKHSLEFLLHHYRKIIAGKYDAHQPIQKGHINEEGDVWFLEHDRLGGQNWSLVREQFEHPKFTKLYEDQEVLLFTIDLMCEKIIYDICSNEMNYFETGFWIDPVRPYDIIPYKEDYRYHYKLVTYYELYNILGESSMGELNEEYQTLLKKMQRKLEIEKESRKICKSILQRKINPS